MNAYIRQESLYHNQSDSPEKTALKRSKKLVIGKHAINALIKGFIDLERSEQSRRWVRSRQDSWTIHADRDGRWESLRWSYLKTVQTTPKGSNLIWQDCKLLPNLLLSDLD